MGVNDFFDDEEDWINFEEDDDFEDFEVGNNLFSDLLGKFSDLGNKFYIGILTIVFISFGLYFLNYRDNSQVTVVENEVVEENKPVELNEQATNTTIQSTNTTVKVTTTLTSSPDSNDFQPYLATVLIYAPGCEQSGSGTIVSNLGFILTNDHVVSNYNTPCEKDIIIFVSEAPDKDPIPKYYANIVANDEFLDIAFLEITSGYEDNYVPNTFYSACVGNSDTVDLSDKLLIWGYPDARFIDYTKPPRIDVSEGFVSGFDSESGISEKAWLAVSSTISSGNSGGGAYNNKFELVGVPTGVVEGNLGSRGYLRPSQIIVENFNNLFFKTCSNN